MLHIQMNHTYEHLNVTGSIKEENVDEGKEGREENKDGSEGRIKGKKSSPMEWTIKYLHRYIYIYYLDSDIYANEVYMYIF